MRASERRVLEETYASWAQRDLAATLARFDPDVVFVIHLPPDVGPYVGEVRGRAQLAKTLQMILDDFDFLDYRALQITADGESFHSRIRFHYRHKATGLDYDGTMRHVWQVAGGMIVRFEEFHDAQRVRTFFAMVTQALGHTR
jgi:ketosteroid isomerase-like protein